MQEPHTDSERPRVGVSSCLLGQPVRFNGGHKQHRWLTGELAEYVDWVPFCPEVEIGLGVPREPIHLTADGRLVGRDSGSEHSPAMDCLPLPFCIDGYVFKAKSPSCGIRGLPRYSPEGQVTDRAGQGRYARRVLEAFPLLAVEDEGRLSDERLREAFTERLFATARLRRLLAGKRGPRELTDFHARHKLQLMAHDPAVCREAGQALAGPGDASRYADLFRAAFGRRATRGRHAHVLQYAYGHISRDLDKGKRSDFLDRVDAYRHGEVPLSIPVALLEHHAISGAMPWLAGQTYLRPYPQALRLRHGI